MLDESTHRQDHQPDECEHDETADLPGVEPRDRRSRCEDRESAEGRLALERRGEVVAREGGAGAHPVVQQVLAVREPVGDVVVAVEKVVRYDALNRSRKTTTQMTAAAARTARPCRAPDEPRPLPSSPPPKQGVPAEDCAHGQEHPGSHPEPAVRDLDPVPRPEGHHAETGEGSRKWDPPEASRTEIGHPTTASTPTNHNAATRCTSVMGMRARVVPGIESR